MINQYFLEFAGVIVILYAKLLTEANPLIMAITFFAVFSMAQGITTGYFTPLGPIAMLMLGKIGPEEFIWNLSVQILAMLCVVVTFLPTKAFIEQMRL